MESPKIPLPTEVYPFTPHHPILQATGNYLIVREHEEFSSSILKIKRDEADHTQTVWIGEIISIGANILERDRLIAKSGAAPEGWQELRPGDLVLIRPSGCRRLKDSDLWTTEINSICAVLGPDYDRHVAHVKAKRIENEITPGASEDDSGGDEITGRVLIE